MPYPLPCSRSLCGESARCTLPQAAVTVARNMYEKHIIPAEDTLRDLYDNRFLPQDKGR